MNPFKANTIQIGNQTAFSADDIMAPFEYCIEKGFSAFEWFPDKKDWGQGWTEDYIQLSHRCYIKKTAAINGIRQSVHAPVGANPLRPEAHELVKKSVDFAGNIGAVLINIHLHTEEGIQRYVDCLKPIIELTARAGLMLSIENTVVTGPGDFNHTFYLIRNLHGINVSHVGMCLDIGHANIWHETKYDYIKFIDMLDKEVPIIHIHAHENYGDADTHLPLFTGPAGQNQDGIIVFSERMKERRFKGSIIFEQWPEPPHLLDNAWHRLVSIIGSECVPQHGQMRQIIFPEREFFKGPSFDDIFPEVTKEITEEKAKDTVEPEVVETVDIEEKLTGEVEKVAENISEDVLEKTKDIVEASSLPAEEEVIHDTVEMEGVKDVIDKTEVLQTELKESPELSVEILKEHVQESSETLTEKPQEELSEKLYEEKDAPVIADKFINIEEGERTPFFETLIEANRTHGSWRKKLEWIAGLFQNDDIASNFSNNIDDLIYLAVYLHFLNTGAIKCEEDGGHYRPSHHARASMNIHRALLGIQNSENVFIIRKMLLRLPSYGNEYTRAEPLTRIRDIAHRNDIPQELKKEIKHTLQNKLHRCAGPEDLETSKNILERITAKDADYSKDFVEQFKIFHTELTEFFNAASLFERLENVRDKDGASILHDGSPCIVGNSINGLIEMFLSSTEDGDYGDPEEMSQTIHVLACLREVLLYEGQRDLEARGQRLLLTEIALENFAFVLFSDLYNKLQNMSGFFAAALDGISQLLRNIQLSSYENEELSVISNELNQWIGDFNQVDRLHILRLKATLERAVRFTHDYGERVVRGVYKNALTLGKELGIDQNSVMVYCEDDIRGNLVFQLSKMLSFLLGYLRLMADLQYWDTLSTGVVQGNVIRKERLTNDNLEGQLIILADNVEGDEYLPSNVKAVIVPHEIAHLSHFAIRARQAGVVLVCVLDEQKYSNMCELAGSEAVIKADYSTFLFEKYTPVKDRPESQSKNLTDIMGGLFNNFIAVTSTDDKKTPLHDVVEPRDNVLFMPDIKVKNSGQKAFNIKRLNEISLLSDGNVPSFRTPREIVVPFGAMVKGLKSVSNMLFYEYEKIADDLENISDDGEVKRLTGRLHEIINTMPVHDSVVEAVESEFKGVRFLAVRSSSNCEDTDDTMGAGLYDSVLGVKHDGVEEAVRTVWSSLWNERAFYSRRKSGVKQRNAHMAVIIQEMVEPDYSFIMHTVNPVSKNPDEIYIELAPGLGEILTSGAFDGSAYRLLCDGNKENLKGFNITVQSFANYSKRLVSCETSQMTQRIVDYTNERLTTDTNYRDDVAKRLFEIGVYLESVFDGRPQDIEGAVTADDAVYVLQSRTLIL